MAPVVQAVVGPSPISAALAGLSAAHAQCTAVGVSLRDETVCPFHSWTSLGVGSPRGRVASIREKHGFRPCGWGARLRRATVAAITWSEG